MDEKLSRKINQKFTSNKYSYLELYDHATDKEVKIILKGLHYLERTRNTNKFIRIGVAALLTVIGVAGIFLPIIPGIIFIVAGLAIFSSTLTKKLENSIEKYVEWKEEKLTKK